MSDRVDRIGQKGAGIEQKCRVLVVVHVFYPEIWPELAACIRNIGACEIIVTYGDEQAVVAARRDFPNAKFLLCENRGYDVWPFLKAIQGVDLAAYDLVVKLHTKRDVEWPGRIVVNNAYLNGPNWRRYLLAFVKTPEAWSRTKACFANSRVGLVADRHVVFVRNDAVVPEYRASFDTARETLNAIWRLHVPANARFVGGTMFAVRSSALRPFQDHPFSAEQFSTSCGHDKETLAHVVERMLGLAICGQGLRVVAFNGSVVFRRIRWAIAKFFFDNRRSARRHSIRIFKITVYRKKLEK